MESIIEAKKRIISYGLSAIKKSPELFVEFDEVFRMINNGESCGCEGEVESVFHQWQQDIERAEMQEELKKNPVRYQLHVNRIFYVIEERGEAYSVHNMTDEKAVELLAANENRVDWFSTLPDNWREEVGSFLAKKNAGTSEIKSDSITPDGIDILNQVNRQEEPTKKSKKKNK